MKPTLITAALLSAFIALPVSAQGGSMHHGMGPGMMGGGMIAGHGMGPGMMGGGMGMGMMGDCGFGGYSALNLTSEQRAKLDEIQRDLWRKQQQLMGRMHEQDFHMHDLYAAGVDEERARKAFGAMTVARKEMFKASLDAGKRMNAVLTQEQREQLQRGRRGGYATR